LNERKFEVPASIKKNQTFTEVKETKKGNNSGNDYATETKKVSQRDPTMHASGILDGKPDNAWQSSRSKDGANNDYATNTGTAPINPVLLS